MAIIAVSCNKTSTTTSTTDTSNSGTTTTYNELFVPPAITGTNFNLTLAKATKQFKTGAATSTYGYNGNSFWGPTLIMNQGDDVKINVTNNLTDQTTVHWHGSANGHQVSRCPYRQVRPAKFEVTLARSAFDVRSTA